MTRNIIVKSVLLALIASVAIAQPALAYIDPNTGGQLFQLLVVIFTFFSAIFLFFSSYFKMAFARGKRFVRDMLGAQPTQSKGTPANTALSGESSSGREFVPDE